MKVLHIIGGGDVGGAKTHILPLLKEINNYIEIKMICLRPGEFSDEGRAMGIDIDIINTGNIIKDIKTVSCIIKEENYDIIHSHGAKANMFSALITRKLKIPTITTVHSDYRLDYLRSKYKMLTYGVINTIALRFIDNYIAVSSNFRDMLIKRRFHDKKIYTLYNGVNFDENTPFFTRKQFSEKYNIYLKDDDVVIGILARLDPVKRFDIFLNAAVIVLKQEPNIKFIIGGDGIQLSDLKHIAADLGISSNVYFPGWVDKNDFFNCIDINVLTSISESFSYAILEGTLHKKATICSKVGGFPDLIDHGENGFLFEPGNYNELASYIISLALNEKRRKEMGEMLYEKAKEKFSLKQMCSTQLKIYQQLNGNC